MSGLGGGWRNRFDENAPMLYRRLPPDVRARIVRTWLGPSGAWPVKKSIEGTPVLLGHVPKHAESRNGQEPERHDRAERATDTCGALGLDRK